MTGSRDIRRCGAAGGWALLVAIALVLGALWAPCGAAWGLEAAEDASQVEAGAADVADGGEGAATDPAASQGTTGTEAADKGENTAASIEDANKNTVATGDTVKVDAGGTSQKAPEAEEPQDGVVETPEAGAEAVSEPQGSQGAGEAQPEGGESADGAPEDGGEAPVEGGQEAGSQGAPAQDDSTAAQDGNTESDGKAAVGTEKTGSSAQVVSDGGADGTGKTNAQVNTVNMVDGKAGETSGAKAVTAAVSTSAKVSVLRRAPSTVTVKFDATQGVGVTSAGTNFGTVSGTIRNDPSGSYPTTVKITVPTTANVQDDNGNGWSADGWTNELGGTSYKVAAGINLSVADLLTALGLDASTTSVTLYPVWSEPTITITYSVDKPTFGKVSKDKDVIGTISHVTSSADGTIGCTATGQNGGAFFQWTVGGNKSAANYTNNPNAATIVPNLSAIQSYLKANGATEFPFIATFDTASISVIYDQGFNDDGSAVTDASVPAAVTVTDTTSQKGYLSSEGNRKASGYKFEGWYLDTSYATAASSLGGGDPTYEQMAAVQTPKDNSITLYAKWSVLTQDYTVEWWKYDYLGVKVGSSPIYTTTRSGQVSKQVGPTTDDTQLVGVPAANKAQLVGYDYDANLSTLGPETLQEGVSVTFALAFRERSGYKVSYDLQNGVGGKLINGSTITDKADQRWLATSIVPSTTASDQPTRVGYTFDGWYYMTGTTNATTGMTTFPTYDYKTTVPTTNATYAELVANDPDIMEVRVYAKWVEDEVTITYQANNPSYGELSASSGAKPGQKLHAVTSTDGDVVACTAKANKGYKFTGWKLAGTGGYEDLPTGFTSGENNETIKPLKEAVSGTDIYKTATYVAVFEVDQQTEDTAKHYTVYFNGNGPSSGVDQVRGQVNDSNSQAMTENEAVHLDANGFQRTGFTFKCWNTVAEPTAANPGKEYGDGDLVSNLLGTDFEDGAKLEYLYAQWTELKAKIKYSAGAGGQVSSHEEEVPDVTGTPLGCRAMPDKGYKFVGWVVVDGGTSSSSASSASGARALAAASAGNTTGTSSSNVIVDPSSPTLRLAKGSSNLWVAESYEAQFEPITYTVDYEANGGSGQMDSDTFTYGIRKAVSSNKFTREGYDFQGWNTSSDGSGTDVNESYTESKLSETDGDTVTLYAQWKEEQKKEDPGTTDDPGTDEPTNPTDEPTDEPTTPTTDDPTDTPSTDEPAEEPTTPTTDEPTNDTPSTDEPTTDTPSTDTPSTSTDTKTKTSSTNKTTTAEVKPAVAQVQEPATEPAVEAPVAEAPAVDVQPAFAPASKAKTALPQTGDTTPPVALLLVAGLLLISGTLRAGRGTPLLPSGAAGEYPFLPGSGREPRRKDHAGLHRRGQWLTP